MTALTVAEMIKQQETRKKAAYVPASLRDLPKPAPGHAARSNARKRKREQSELTIREAIIRIKEARRSAPHDWERGYNSAITQLEILLGEIQSGDWEHVQARI